MKGAFIMRLGYVRVSTQEQHEERQIKDLEKYEVEKWFIEKISGKDTQRPKLQEMLDFAREGDVVYISDFSRLARNIRDLLEIVDQMNSKGIKLISDKEQIETGTALGELMLYMIAAIAEFERKNLLERQREGIAIRKAKHGYSGRKPVHIADFPQWYERYKAREFNKRQLAEKLHISRPTLDKLIRSEERRLSEIEG
ncbi:MAG: recombinase family protein [Enterocloster clostridioformis]